MLIAFIDSVSPTMANDWDKISNADLPAALGRTESVYKTYGSVGRAWSLKCQDCGFDSRGHPHTLDKGVCYIINILPIKRNGQDFIVSMLDSRVPIT